MSDSKRETAFVFEDESYAGSDLVHFGGFPGVFMPGQAVAASELGFDTISDAQERADELGLPVKRTTVAAGKGKPAERVNHMPNQLEAGRDFEPEAGQPGAKLGEGEVFPPAPEAAAPAAAELSPIEATDEDAETTSPGPDDTSTEPR
jgi:hypothetical protein